MGYTAVWSTVVLPNSRQSVSKSAIQSTRFGHEADSLQASTYSPELHYGPAPDGISLHRTDLTTLYLDCSSLSHHIRPYSPEHGVSAFDDDERMVQYRTLDRLGTSHGGIVADIMATRYGYTYQSRLIDHHAGCH